MNQLFKERASARRFVRPTTTLSLAGGLLAFASVMPGCAQTGPTPELVDARRAYQEAEAGPAGELERDELVRASEALEKAEQAHADDPGSAREQHLAYIAERRAQLAAARARRHQEDLARENAEEQYTEGLENVAQSARAQREQVAEQLDETRDQLRALADEHGEQSAELQQRTAQLQAQESELIARQEELDRARQQREAAEREAMNAMQRLDEISDIRQTERELVISLNGAVLFRHDDANLLPIAERRLDEVASALKEQPNTKEIVVEGHTDSRGSESYNRDLSQRRAQAVASYLVGQGLDQERVQAVGRGESEPLATNDNATGRANNRRVEIIVRDREGASGEQQTQSETQGSGGTAQQQRSARSSTSSVR